MSEIRATTISNAAGTGPATLTGQSAAKAWTRWNQSGTQAINGSFNTSSIVDGGTGITTALYTSNMANGNYSVTTGVGELTGGGNRGIGVRGTTKPPSVDGCAYLAFTTSWGAADIDLCTATIAGDLA